MKKQATGLSYYSKLLALFCIATSTAVISTSCTNNAGGSPTIEQQLPLTHKLNQKEQLLNEKFKDNKLWQRYLKTTDQYLKANIEPPVHMGDSYDSRTMMPKGTSCLVNYEDPNNIDISNPKGRIDLATQITFQKLSSILGINTGIGLTAKGSWGSFSLSDDSEYLRGASDTRQDIHFNYYQTAMASVSYKVKGKGNNILEQDAKDILEKGEGLSGFGNVCGDSFVSSANVGAVLFVDIAIHFDTQAHMQSFEDSMKGQAMNIINVTDAYKSANNSYSGSSTIKVSAMQLGGDAQKLADIFGEKKPGTNYPVVDCAGGKVDQCVDVLNGVIDYAKNDFAHGIDFTHPKNLYIFEYTTKKFEELDVKAKFNDISEEAQKDNLLLLQNIKHDRMMLQYLKQYQEQKDLLKLLPISTIKELESATKKYEDIVAEYDNQNVMGACYGIDADHLCVAAWKYINEVTHPYYSDAIDFAANMSDTILVQSPGSRKYYYALVPSLGHCNQLGECTGSYVIYEQQEVPLKDKDNHEMKDSDGDLITVRTLSHIKKTVCYVDTTANNSYFKNSFPEYVGKNMVCETVPDKEEEAPKKTMYVKRIEGDTRHSIVGDYVNGVEKDRPVDASKSNVELKYSGQYSKSDQLLYNPI